MIRPYSGHAPGHIRDAFCEAVDAFYEWDGKGPEPTIIVEVHYEPRQISLSEACALVWNCTDIMPGSMVDQLRDCDLEFKMTTYAAGARALSQSLGELATTHDGDDGAV